MDKPRQSKYVGIAGFFSETQIRDLFVRYLSLIIVVEIFLLLIMLCGSVAVYKQPFPIKLYLILALSIPLGMTFLLGVFVMAFNKFIFEKNKSGDANEMQKHGGQTAWFSKSDLLFERIHKIPFIVKIFMTLLIIPVLFKLDDIIGFYAGIGAQTVRYLAIAVIVLIGTTAIFGTIWMVMSFRLKKRQMDYEYRYRKDVMDKLELMVLDNDTIVDRNGKVISIKKPAKTEDQPAIIDGEYEIRPLPMEEKGAIATDRTSFS